MADKIYVIAGEASGDLHGANLIAALREARPGVEIYGVGGDRIREAGARDFYDLAHFHVTGITDALKRLPDYRRAETSIFSSIVRSRPDLVVLIDNPGFNLHMAEKIRSLGIPIVYYIAPQVWAWAPKRIRKIKRCVAKVLVVFEFEKKIYEDAGIPVAWVGHPLKDLLSGGSEGAAAGNRVALLPGSRKGELKMLFDVFVKSAAILRRRVPDATFSLIKAPSLPRPFYERLMRTSPVPLELVEEGSYASIRKSRLAIVCSGTATLECALLGTPMVICNRGTLVTYVAAKALIRVPYLGLPNLILGSMRIPELLQFDANPAKIAAEAERLLTDEAARETMKRDLEEVSRRLGAAGAARRAAAEVLNVLPTKSAGTSPTRNS
ncbi:MAG TPA: lipid-A-disaccharide synthase [Candidatus Eisenbacteria bacterium]|nr:lipid-A-disaccharide synthase [Candidatus Eisenbacteria bacterium]